MGVVCIISGLALVGAVGYFGGPQPAAHSSAPALALCQIVHRSVQPVDCCAQLISGDIFDRKCDHQPAPRRPILCDMGGVCCLYHLPHLRPKLERAPPLAHRAEPDTAKAGCMEMERSIRQALKLGKGGAACQSPRFVQILGCCGWELALCAALDDFAGLGVVLDAVRCGGQPKLGVYGCAQRRARRLKLIIWRHSSQSQSVVYFGQHQPLYVVLAPWSGFAICPPVNEGLTAPRLYGILVVHIRQCPLGYVLLGWIRHP